MNTAWLFVSARHIISAVCTVRKIGWLTLCEFFLRMIFVELDEVFQGADLAVVNSRQVFLHKTLESSLYKGFSFLNQERPRNFSP